MRKLFSVWSAFRSSVCASEKSDVSEELPNCWGLDGESVEWRLQGVFNTVDVLSSYETHWRCLESYQVNWRPYRWFNLYIIMVFSDFHLWIGRMWDDAFRKTYLGIKLFYFQIFLDASDTMGWMFVLLGSIEAKKRANSDSSALWRTFTEASASRKCKNIFGMHNIV